MQDIDGTFPDRGIRTRSLLAVLRSTIMPAVLVETAFIDNDIDALLLMNHQQEIAAAIARGITDYWVQINGQ
jgi:N-acetylmuramoyl-L-alanine amidase